MKENKETQLLLEWLVKLVFLFVFLPPRSSDVSIIYFQPANTFSSSWSDNLRTSSTQLLVLAGSLGTCLWHLYPLVKSDRLLNVVDQFHSGRWQRDAYAMGNKAKKHIGVAEGKDVCSQRQSCFKSKGSILSTRDRSTKRPNPATSGKTLKKPIKEDLLLLLSVHIKKNNTWN